MRLALLFLIPTLCFGQKTPIKLTSGNRQGYRFNVTSTELRPNYKQAAWDAIATIPDLVISTIKTTSGSGGMYTDTGLTTEATSNTNILGVKSFGVNPGSITTLPHNNPSSYPVSSALTWWKNDSGASSIIATFGDRGNYERFMRVHNAPLGVNQWETNPGSLASNKTHPIDIIWVARYMPSVSYETFAVGPIFFKDEGGVLNVNGMITSTAMPYYTRNIYRLKIDASGRASIWLNGFLIHTATGQSVNTNELNLGTNSHTMYVHFFCSLSSFKVKGFEDDQVNKIMDALRLIWPLKNPDYPSITDMWQGGFNSWNGTAWQPGRTYTPVFTGGNGIEGTHLYQWYYWDDNDATLFPSADNELTNHRQIPTSIDLTTMGTGDDVSVISIDGVNLMSSTVNWATSTAATTTAIAANINAFQTNYLAVVKDATAIQLHPNNNSYRADVIAFTASGFTPTVVQSAKSSTLTGATYNVAGQIYNGHFSDGTIKTMCVIYPRDSNGNIGEPITTSWTAKNF